MLAKDQQTLQNKKAHRHRALRADDDGLIRHIHVDRRHGRSRAPVRVNKSRCHRFVDAALVQDGRGDNVDGFLAPENHGCQVDVVDAHVEEAAAVLFPGTAAMKKRSGIRSFQS